MFELTGISPREYQLKIAESCMRENTLVVLPTGLGKTIIALLVASSRLRSLGGRIIVMAPTRPLAEQHMRTFMKYMNASKDSFALLTGEVSFEKRKQSWEGARVLFATPQTVYNDVVSGRASLRDFVLAVFDEAHRSVKDYTYTKVAEIYASQSSNPRILGLTASPGSSVERVSEITRNLFITKVETRTEKDKDVSAYVEGISIESKFVDLPSEYKGVIQRLKELLDSRLSKLLELGLLQERRATRKELIELGNKIRDEIRSQRSGYLYTALTYQVQALAIHHAIELIETQGAYALNKYLERLEKRQVRSIQALVRQEEWRQIVKEAERIRDVEHSKYYLLVNEIEKQIAENADSRILVFAQYRDTIEHITSILSKSFSVARFVGQADKEGSEGMDQKEQQEILSSFESGRVRILVSSSIGEEGLHVPDVDLVIFYDAVPSEIRAIQRRGRTGRSKKGRVVLLVAKNTTEQGYYYTSIIKERKMRKIIESSKKERREPSLLDYL